MPDVSHTRQKEGLASARLVSMQDWLELVQWGAKLKIFLGYAPGVGKSYRMLDETRRRHERGEDVVVGAVQGKQSEDIQALLRNWN
jgi:two-component system, OmpR family, sensor histidine kinase KdpD